jgi:hypothetical protein
MVTLAKKQYTRDDEPTIFCISQDKNIDNEIYYVPNLLIPSTMIHENRTHDHKGERRLL